MDGGVTLTRGAIADISNNTGQHQRPVVQVTELRLVSTSKNNSERYRLVLSDGTHWQQAMLATQMNALVADGSVQKGSIVQLNEFICNTIQNRRIVIIVHLDVLVGQCDLIGEPKNYDASCPAFGQPRPSVPPGGQEYVSDTDPVPNANSGVSVSGQSVATGMHVRPMMEQKTANVGGHGMLSPGASFPSYGVTNNPYSGANADSRMQNLNNQKFPNSGMSGPLHSRSVASPYQQPSMPMYQNRGPIAKNEAPARVVPIAALNPYQGRWTIKARVTAKGDLRRYNSTKGEGKVFSFDLLDSEGGEIRVTCFNNEADQFYGQIEAGKVYMISRGSLKPAQKKFNHLNNDYEIFLESASLIQPCPDDGSIAKQLFSFRPISEIEVAENFSTVDVIGIVSSINPSVTIMTKNGTEVSKRTLTLKDTSGRSVEVTFWGNFCNAEGQQLQNMCDAGVYPVLAVKSGRVNDFNGKSLGTVSTSQLFIDPDFPEAHRLKEWYNREGKHAAVVSISREMPSTGRNESRKTVSQIKDEGLGRSEKPDWITVKASISFIKTDNFCYTACPLMVGERQCNKKVTNNGDGNWHCDRCDRSFPECDYRYLLQFQIQDHTGLTWVTAFQESGEDIMGLPAKNLYLLKYEEQEDAKFAEVIRGVLFNQFLFKLKVKEETFSDEQRVKSTVVKAEKIIPSSESNYLLGSVDKLLGEEPTPAYGKYAAANTDSGIPSVGQGMLENRYANAGGTRNVGNSYQQEAAPYRANQYANDYGGVSGYGNDGGINRRVQQITCTLCGSAGHGPQNCPKSMAGQGVQTFGGGFANRSSYASTGNTNTNNSPSTCYKCHQPGHWARDCPGGSNAISSGYGNTTKYGY